MHDPTPAAPLTRTRPILGRIGGVLKVVRALIAYANHFTATVTTRACAPEFATAAAIFGTYDVAVIMLRMNRGIQRAMALQRYLLARAARGCNLRFAWPPRVALLPHHRPAAKPRSPNAEPDRKPGPDRDPALLDPDHVNAFRLISPDEFDREVSRRPIGRTMTYICLDLGIVPGLCAGEFWDRVDKILRRYGGSLNRIYEIRARREKTFQRERDRRPETWDTDWRDLRRSTVRQAIGCLIGETPSMPDGTPATALPAIVPA